MTFPTEECCEPQLHVVAMDEHQLPPLVMTTSSCDEKQDEKDQLKKLQSWFQEQQPKLQNATIQFISKFDIPPPTCTESKVQDDKSAVSPLQDTKNDDGDIETVVGDDSSKTLEKGTENDQVKKLQRWFQEQQPKLQSAKTRFLSKFEIPATDSTVEDASFNVKKEDNNNVVENVVLVESSNNNDNDDDVFIMTREEGVALARKVGCAVVGGSLIVVGIPLIPLPGPGDFMVVGGFAVLATEFDAARRVLDGARDKLVEVLDGNKQEQQQQQEEEEQEDAEKQEEQKDEVDDNENGGIDVEGAVREVKKHAERLGRNVVLPLLNTVCTERPTDEQNAEDEDESGTDVGTSSSSKDRGDNTSISKNVVLNESETDENTDEESCETLESEEWELCAFDGTRKCLLEAATEAPPSVEDGNQELMTTLLVKDNDQCDDVSL